MRFRTAPKGATTCAMQQVERVLFKQLVHGKLHVASSSVSEISLYLWKSCR